MPDTLLGFQAAMNGIPDNTSALISPQNAREAWLSLASDRGVAIMDQGGVTPVTIPLVQDVFSDIPQGIIAGGGGMLEGDLPLFWRMDANGQLGYDYLADWPTTAVPPGYFRQVKIVAEVEVALGSTVDRYEFATTVAGIPQAPFIGIEEAQNQSENVVYLAASVPIEVGVAPAVSVAVRNEGSSTGLDIIAFGLFTDGGPPA